MNFNEELKSFADGIQSPNILITGRVGAGKSTLLNAIFGKELSRTGVAFGGLTKSFIRHGAEGEVPLTLFDSPGFEMGKEQQFLQDMSDFLTSQQKQGRKGQIHLAWYVVNTPLARFEAFEHDLIRRFTNRKIPVIAVMSQCDRASEVEKTNMLTVLRHATGGMTFEVIPVSADPLEVDGEPLCLPFGLEELVMKTVERLPEAYKHAFVATQIVSITAKRVTAYAYITAAASLCLATGYLPIPFTTPVSIYFAQTQLAVKLASLYDYEQKQNITDALRALSLSGGGLTVFLSTSVFNLFLFNPITSTLAGATAGAYIMMVGLALCATFEEAASLQLEGRSSAEIAGQFGATFRKSFQAWRKRINIKSAADLQAFKDAFVSGT